MLQEEYVESMYNIKYINEDGVEVVGNLDVIKITDQNVRGYYFRGGNTRIVLNHIVEADLVALQKVTTTLRSGGEKSNK